MIKFLDGIYESHKQVRVAPMNRLDYNLYRNWKLPSDECGLDAGYLVEYLDGGKPNDSRHTGYISWSPKEQFDNGYASTNDKKSLGNTDINTTKSNVSDLVVFGNGDMFKLLSKASSKNQGWMKSTKAMEIPRMGCLVQVTTQQGDNVAEALQFIPGVKIEVIIGHGEVIGRELVPF